MGELTISVGPITSTLTFDNAKGATIINDYINGRINPVAAGPGEPDIPPMSNQDKLDWLVRDIARHVRAEHTRKKRREAAVAAIPNSWE